jgi:hypothetical protein
MSGTGTRWYAGALPSPLRPVEPRRISVYRPDAATARSTFERHPPRIGDPDANHLYNCAARTRDSLSLRCCEAFMDEASDHVAVEPMHERKLALRDAV